MCAAAAHTGGSTDADVVVSAWTEISFDERSAVLQLFGYAGDHFWRKAGSAEAALPCVQRVVKLVETACSEQMMAHRAHMSIRTYVDLARKDGLAVTSLPKSSYDFPPIRMYALTEFPPPTFDMNCAELLDIANSDGDAFLEQTRILFGGSQCLPIRVDDRRVGIRPSSNPAPWTAEFGEHALQSFSFLADKANRVGLHKLTWCGLMSVTTPLWIEQVAKVLLRAVVIRPSNEAPTDSIQSNYWTIARGGEYGDLFKKFNETQHADARSRAQPNHDPWSDYIINFIDYYNSKKPSSGASLMYGLSPDRTFIIIYLFEREELHSFSKTIGGWIEQEGPIGKHIMKCVDSRPDRPHESHENEMTLGPWHGWTPGAPATLDTAPFWYHAPPGMWITSVGKNASKQNGTGKGGFNKNAGKKGTGKKGRKNTGKKNKTDGQNFGTPAFSASLILQ